MTVTFSHSDDQILESLDAIEDQNHKNDQNYKNDLRVEPLLSEYDKNEKNIKKIRN